jgi:hypothetical protein
MNAYMKVFIAIMIMIAVLAIVGKIFKDDTWFFLVIAIAFIEDILDALFSE